MYGWLFYNPEVTEDILPKIIGRPERHLDCSFGAVCESKASFRQNLSGTTPKNLGVNAKATPQNVDNMSNYIPLFVGSVFILVSLLPGPIMRGRSGIPYKNQKLTRIVTALLGFTILLAWYSQRH
jgi:hypothetical protein